MVLPEPDSPMMVTVSPHRWMNETAVDGADDAGGGDQLDWNGSLEASEAQSHASVRLPSSAADAVAQAVAQQVDPDHQSTITKPGRVTIHHEVVM